MTVSPLELDALAWAIDADGLVAHEAAAAEVAELATEAAVSPALVQVLSDTGLPVPVRERAFGHIVVALARTITTDSPDWALAN